MREDVFILSYTVVPWDREDFILQTNVGSSIVHTISVRNCLQGIPSLTSFLPSLVAFHSRFSRVLLAVFALIFSFAQLSPFHHGGRTPVMHTSSRRQTTTAHSQARHGTARHGNQSWSGQGRGNGKRTLTSPVHNVHAHAAHLGVVRVVFVWPLACNGMA